MGMGSFAYRLVFLLHLGAIVVGFGSSFVYPVLATKARGMEPRDAFTINHAVMGISKFLTTIPIYIAIFFGICLVILSDETWKFSQTWVSVAFLLVILSICVAQFLHMPNLKAMDALQDTLVNGKPTPGKDGGPPKEVLELQERGPKAGMYGGILHLLWLLLMIDMIWKPGLGI